MIYLDIETRSRCDLKKAGAYRYAEDPSTRVVILAYAVDDGPVQLATDSDEIASLFREWAGRPKIAHNSAFDRVVLSRVCGMPWEGLDDPADWDDTMAVAAEHGYPKALGDLAKALGVEEKDTAGTRLINLFSKPNRSGGFNDADTHPEQWADFTAYAAQDVETLRAVHRALPGWPTPLERQLWVVDQRINDRGIRLDVELARAASEAGAAYQHDAEERLRRVLGVDNPRSVAQVLAGLAETGLQLDNLRAETVRTALAGELSETQRSALELRQELALSSGKKFDAALTTVCSDDRVRGTLKFYGAGATGRWGGSGIQPQNLTSTSITATEAEVLDRMLEHGEDAETARSAEDARRVREEVAELKRTRRSTPATLKALVRPMLDGPLVVVDYAAIEARVLAWLAGERWVLEAFRAGRDIYTETAARLGPGYTRTDGKIATLALGFGGGVNSLVAFGAEGNREELQQLVTRWREANARIVRLWDQIERAMWSGGSAGDKLHVTASRGIRRLRLPSGRELVYRGVHVQDGRYGRELVYRGDRGLRTISRMVGVENPTQAIARDLLARSLVRLEKRGFPVILHVHDEVVVEGEHDPDEVVRVMCEGPDWAEGLPLAAKGEQVERYQK